jgi:hypothetical protein
MFEREAPVRELRQKNRALQRNVAGLAFGQRPGARSKGSEMIGPKRILTYLTYIGVGVLIGLVLIATGVLNRPSTPPSPGEIAWLSQPPGPPSQPVIKYEVVEQWAIGNAGMGRAISVDPAQRTEAALLALADQLKRETTDTNGIVTIFIYDDRGAAALRRAALSDELNDRSQKLHDDHMIGNYTRNPNTGHHSIMVALDGVSAETKTIPLQ